MCLTLFPDYKSSCVSRLRHAFYLLGMKCIVGFFVVQMWAKPRRVLRYQNWLTENSNLPLVSNPTWICIVHPFEGSYNLVLLWKLYHFQVDIIFKAHDPYLVWLVRVLLEITVVNMHLIYFAPCFTRFFTSILSYVHTSPSTNACVSLMLALIFLFRIRFSHLLITWLHAIFILVLISFTSFILCLYPLLLMLSETACSAKRQSRKQQHFYLKSLPNIPYY